jgi:hypothetical protein
VHPVPGDLPQVLPSSAERRLLLPHGQDCRDLGVRGAVLVEAVPAGAPEGTERAAEHGLSDVPVIASPTVEALFAAVVDAGNP